MSSIIKSYGYPPMKDTTSNYTLKEKQIPNLEDITPKSFKNHSVVEQQTICEDILTKAKADAKTIMEKAKLDSQKLIEEAEYKLKLEYQDSVRRGHQVGIERGMLEGERRGYSKGYDEGFDVATQECNDISDKTMAFMHSVIEGIDEGKHDLLRKYQDDLTDVAFAMAKMIVKKEIEIKPETIKTIVESAALMCRNQDFIHISVSDNSYKLLTEEKGDFINRITSLSEDVKIIADMNMKDDECIIETPIGLIDASVNTQLDNIETAVKEKGQQQ